MPEPEPSDRFWEMFHGIPGWLYDAWTCDRTPPVSRGAAWRDGTYAACQHQLTGPPKYGPVPRIIRPVYPRWYIDLLVMNIRRAHAEHPELFDPRSWLTNAPEVNTTIRQLAEQRPDALRLYDRDWNIATEPGTAVHALPRTVARDYPPPPPAESPFAVSAEDIWYAANYRNVAGTVLPTWLVDRLGIELTAQRPRPPRTDFMPRYPNGGRR